MGEADDEPIESPATWENVVAGKVWHVLGKVTGDAETEEEGEEQAEIAHEVREEYDHEHES